jgi:hypothetical protein
MKWSEVSKSSRTLEVLRAARGDSVVVAWYRHASARLPFLARDVQRDTLPDDRLVLDEVEDSWVVRHLARAVELLDRGWRSSRAAGAVADLFRGFMRVDVSFRVRWLAVVALSALVVHALLIRSFASAPSFAASAIWSAAILLALTVWFGADAVAAAWSDKSRASGQRTESDRT